MATSTWVRAETAADQEIEPAGAEVVALVADGDRPLAFVGNPSQAELDTERLRVDLLGEAWTQKAVYLDRCADDSVRELVQTPFTAPSPPQFFP